MAAHGRGAEYRERKRHRKAAKPSRVKRAEKRAADREKQIEETDRIVAKLGPVQAPEVA